MDISKLEQRDDYEWVIPQQGDMRVPAVFFASRELLEDMDDKVYQQALNVASLPGIVEASYAMPDAHWGYGFPIGGVAAFDPEQGGVISAGGVGFDISCGVRLLHTGLSYTAVSPRLSEIIDALFRAVPAGVGSRGEISLDDREMTAMLSGGAQWAVARGWGRPEDLERTEERGCMAGAVPENVSDKARKRQVQEMGTLGSGNHYLELQRVTQLFDADIARHFELNVDDVVISIHCGSRGMGHQIGTEFLRDMAKSAAHYHIKLPDRELACAPARSELGQRYLGAMRAAINCALANREIITHLTRRVFATLYPQADLGLLYDVSHNTCKEETHEIAGQRRKLLVHRKGATRALPPRHHDLPEVFRDSGQPVLIGGSMGAGSYVLAGIAGNQGKAFSSACHGAGRKLSRRQARRNWSGRAVVDELAARGIQVRSPSQRGVAEEAPDAYKDVNSVVEVAERAGLARRVARLAPLGVIKG